MLTKEETKILRKYEELLTKAVRTKTATGYTDYIFNELYGVYINHFTKRLSNKCTRCKMTLLITLGELGIKEGIFKTE